MVKYEPARRIEREEVEMSTGDDRRRELAGEDHDQGCAHAEEDDRDRREGIACAPAAESDR